MPSVSVAVTDPAANSSPNSSSTTVIVATDVALVNAPVTPIVGVEIVTITVVSPEYPALFTSATANVCVAPVAPHVNGPVPAVYDVPATAVPENDTA